MFGSFVDSTLLTSALLTIIMLGRSACYKTANIGSLSVNELVVNDLKVNGKYNTPNASNTSNTTESIDNSIIENVLKELEALRQENNILKEKLDNLKLNDLIDVDTIGREEDGAFIGWDSRENCWVPYPEVGN